MVVRQFARLLKMCILTSGLDVSAHEGQAERLLSIVMTTIQFHRGLSCFSSHLWAWVSLKPSVKLFTAQRKLTFVVARRGWLDSWLTLLNGGCTFEGCDSAAPVGDIAITCSCSCAGWWLAGFGYVHLLFREATFLQNAACQKTSRT